MKRHDLDLLSLVFGVLFVLVGVLGLTDRVILSLSDVRWLVPVGLIVIGVALVLPSGRGGTGDEVVPDDDAR
jgi:hypothetical protein